MANSQHAPGKRIVDNLPNLSSPTYQPVFRGGRACELSAQSPASAVTVLSRGPRNSLPITPRSKHDLDPDSCPNPVCHNLYKKYQALSQSFSSAKEALRKRVDERDGWARYASSLERKIATLEKELGTQITNRKRNSALCEQTVVRAAVANAITSTTRASCEESHGDGHEPNSPDASKFGGSGLFTSTDENGFASVDSAQRLTGLASLLPAKGVSVKQESPTGVLVTASTEVSRKRKHHDFIDNLSVVSEPLIKPEMQDAYMPSSPTRHHMPATQESIDLGDVEHTTITPRKPRDSLSLISKSPSAARQTPNTFTPDSDQHPLRTILAPLNANVRSSKPAALVVQPLSYTNKEKISLVGKHRAKDSTGNSRLPMPERRELPFDQSDSPDKMLRVLDRPKASPMLSPRNYPFRKQPPQRNKVPNRRLRERPLSELQLSDFKINPSANEGHDFAYSEVVRNKNERAYLSGCTDLNCCGKQFRALALSQRPNPPLTPAQRMEERRLLETYLGDHSYRLAVMDENERMEVWIEAKTWELANKYGKHRHRFSRKQSPPGFWNADFPDTQELRSDREQAAKREEECLKERFREARRSGGKWIFRDE